MITVPAWWLPYQQQPIRPQGNVEVRILVNATWVIFRNKDIKNLRYTQNGKVNNSVIPTKEVYFECFKEKAKNIVSNQPAKLRFGFNGSVVEIADLRVAKIENFANGLTSKITLNDNYTTINTVVERKLDDVYDKGSRFYQSVTEGFEAQDFFAYLGGEYEDVEGGELGYFLTTKSSIGSALQQLALVEGKTLFHNTVGNNIKFRLLDLIYVLPITNYIVSKSIQYAKPEIAKEEQYRLLTCKYKEHFYDENAKSKKIIENLGAGSSVVAEVDLDKYFRVVRGYQTVNVIKTSQDFNITTFTNISQTPQTFDIDFYDINSEEKSKTYTNEEFENGELIIESGLLNADNVDACATLQNYCIKNNEELEVSCRIDPRVELFDCIGVETEDNTIRYGLVEYAEINFDGGFNGSLKLKLKENSSFPLYITNVSNEQGVFSLNTQGTVSVNLTYKIDSNGTWQTLNVGAQINIPPKSTIYLRGNNLNGIGTSANDYIYFSFDKTCILGGNIMSLIYPDYKFISSNYCFSKIFSGLVDIQNINNLSFSSILILKQYSFSNMFYDVSTGYVLKQTTPITVKFIATSILDNALTNMFSGVMYCPSFTFDLQNARGIGANSVGTNTSGANAETTIIFGKNLTTIPTGTQNNYCADITQNIYFMMNDDNTVLFDLNGKFIAQGSSKTSIVVNVYTDNTQIANASVNKRDQYTTVNIFHLDGTSWGL